VTATENAGGGGFESAGKLQWTGVVDTGRPGIMPGLSAIAAQAALTRASVPDAGSQRRLKVKLVRPKSEAR
jgi:hypothetical protein